MHVFKRTIFCCKDFVEENASLVANVFSFRRHISYEQEVGVVKLYLLRSLFHQNLSKLYVQKKDKVIMSIHLHHVSS